MTKSEIFSAAHAMARAAGGAYRTAFSSALKQIFARAKSLGLIDRLKALGGSLWEKGAFRRVYFNDAAALIGLKYQTYKTGNISNATQNGEEISNAEARRILDRVGKVYFDLVTGKFCSNGSQDALDAIAKTLRAKIA
jgi:hypothetical protein